MIGDFSYRESGDGFEVLDAQGDVIAWTLDKLWALRILLALELQIENGRSTDSPVADPTK